MKKRLTIVMAVVCCLALMVGSLALFTAKADTSGTAKAGNLSISVSEDVIGDALLKGGDADIVDSDELNNWNPGDSAAFTYTITNTGNKAVRYQETIVLTVSGMAAGETEGQEMLTITNTGDNDPAFAATADGYTLTYVVAEDVLSGVQNGTAGVETVDGKATSAAPNYTLAFNKDALNEYQNAEISIDVTVKAIQFANTEVGDIATANIEA